MLHRRIWLLCAICFCAGLALTLADRSGAFARRVPFGHPYLGNCVALQRGFRCTGDPAALKAINIPVRLKVNRDYRISVRGRSLAYDPAIIYIDFFGKNYDAPEQKGQVVLLPGAVTTHVLRWPSDWPPEPAFLRISNRSATDFEITSIEVTKASKWIEYLRNLFLYVGIAILAAGVWRDRRRLLPSGIWSRILQRLSSVGADLAPVLLLASCTALLLLIRVATMTVPMVFGDEMSYALLASSLGDPTAYWRNEILKPLPNQLFFDIYHLATLCGEAMLACARALNCVLFALAALPIFALSRKFVPRLHAMALTAIALALPNNACTSFFMPEAFYFLAFYVAAWAFISFLEPGARTRHAAVAGFALAALSLVKPHGLTILAACVAAALCAIAIWRVERARLAKGLGMMLLVFVVARVVLGISAAPPSGEPFADRMFGLYATLISHMFQIAPDARSLERLRLAAIDNFGSLFLLLGPAFIASTAWLLRSRPAEASCAETRLDRLHLFTGIALAFLVIGTIRFTAYIAGADPSQNPARIHERYYDFSFGLLLIGGYASYRALSWSTRRARIGALAATAVVAGTAIWYLTDEFASLQPSSLDHPVLFAAWKLHDWGIAFLGLALVLAALLVPLRARFACLVYALALVVLAGSGYQSVWSEQAGSQTLWENDRAALALKVLYAPPQLEHGLVVGAELGPLYRTSFYLRSNAAVRIVREHSIVDVAQLAGDSNWVLTYGEYRVVGDWGPGLRLPAGATLYRRPDRK